MYRILRERQNEEREDGFTLIELLVVVIIIGILAAIAIPVFLNQRERAWSSAVQSDLRNAGVAMETYYTDNGDYDAADQAALEAAGLAVSSDVTLTIYRAGQEYCIEGDHANLDASPVATYDPATGGLDTDGPACTVSDAAPIVATG